MKLALMNNRLPLVFLLLATAFGTGAQPARDGVPDPRFGNNGVATFDTIGTTGFRLEGPRDIVEQADGRLLVVARGSRTGSSRPQPMVMRLLVDGSRDESFGEQGVFLAPESGFTAPNGGHASAAVVLDDGRIVVVGSLSGPTEFSNTGCTLVFALTPAGALDESWGPSPGPACLSFGRPLIAAEIPIGNVALAPDSGVYVNGLVGNGPGGSAVLARLDAQGRFDASYDGDGIAFFGTDFSAGMAVHGLRSTADGYVWVLGGRSSAASVAALDPNGQLVQAFGLNGIATYDAFPGLAEYAVDFDVDAAGRIAVMSYSFEIAATIPNAIVRFAANGQLDGSFNPAGQQRLRCAGVGCAWPPSADLARMSRRWKATPLSIPASGTRRRRG
jgi:uncharacterized delta-60 repeat protein